jgi:hypothetical protein
VHNAALLVEDQFEGEQLEENEIQLTGPQTEFLDCDYKFPLFVAGFGAGKSVTMGLSILNDLDHPGADVGAYAPTYDLLKLITIPYLEEFLSVCHIPYRLNKSDYILDVEDAGNIILRSMDNPARIVGYQTFRAHIDEVDTMEEKKADQAWNKIIARNRQKVPAYDKEGNPVMGPNNKPMLHMNRVSAYTTPEGFAFAYKRWVKNQVAGYGMIRASTYSNPHLPPDYIQSLRETYPAHLVEAYLDGDFVNMTSGRVYPKFDRGLHDTDVEWDGKEELHVGIDFNVVHGAAGIHVERNGKPYAVDEIINSYDTDTTILTLKEKFGVNAKIHVYPDASGTKRTSNNTSESDIKKLELAGFRIHTNHSNPSIKDRVASFNAMLMNGLGEIRYRVNITKCPNLTDSLEQQAYTKDGVPDKGAGLDHILDGCGYYINKKFGITKPTANAIVVKGRH